MAQWKLPSKQSFQAWCSVAELFTEAECSKIVGSMELHPATVGSGDVNRVIPEIRESKIQWLEPTDEHCWIYQRLEDAILQANSEHLHMDLENIQCLQLTEYNANYQGYYRGHIDNHYGDPNASRQRKLSLSIQLSPEESYDGGELMLYPESLSQPIIVSKTLGNCILFRSHIIHEVKPVARGTRHSLVCWVTGPEFR